MKRIIILLAFLSSILGAMEPAPKKIVATEHVNVVLLFEEGGDNSYLNRAYNKKYEPDSIIMAFFAALEQNQLLIISSPILKTIYQSFYKADETALIYNYKLNNFVKKAEYLRKVIDTLTLIPTGSNRLGSS